MLNGNGKQCKSINRSSKKSFWLRPEMNINSIIGTNNFVINQIPLNLWTSWAGSTSHILLSNLRDRNKEQQLLLFDPKKRRKKQWRVRMSFVIYHLPWPGDCESFFVLVCGCGSTERAQCHCTGHALSCTCKPGHTCLPGVQPPYIPHRAPPPYMVSTPLCTHPPIRSNNKLYYPVHTVPFPRVV